MSDEAAVYYQQLLDNIDTELAPPLPEYQAHVNSFPVARAEAEAFLAGR